MRITEVESRVVGNCHFVWITTEDGATGLGQSACWAYPEAVHSVTETFRSYLLGKDSSDIERHWQHLYRMGPFRGSILTAAVSAVDIALWDLKGQHLGVPIWQLLGGRCRDHLRLHLLLVGVFTPDELEQTVTSAVNEGYTAVKFDPLPAGYQDMSLPQLIQGCVANLRAAREAGGPEVDIILELHRSLTPLQLPALADALRVYTPLFIEDPVQIDSHTVQADVARRSPLAVGQGERFHTIWEFREMLELGGSQYVRADVGLAGGITHCRKIAALAESHHSAAIWHNWLGPILTAASAHLDLAMPNFVTQEFYPPADEGPMSTGFRTGFRREGGVLLPSEIPGLGVELDVDSVASLDLLGRPLWEIPLRNDGSVAFSV